MEKRHDAKKNHKRTQPSLRRVLDVLEDRTAPAVLSGFLFNDLEGDGVRASSLEPGLSGIDFRLALPGDDGVFDTADDVLLGTFSSAGDGSYSVMDVPDGLVRVDLLEDTLPEAFLPVNADPTELTVLGDTTLDLAIRDARAPLPQIPAGAEAPGEYPVSSVSGANFNVAPRPGSVLGQSSGDELRVEVAASGPFTWTDVRHNRGDIAPSISPYDPNDAASFPPDDFVNWQPSSGPATHSWQINHQVGLAFSTARDNGIENGDTFDGTVPTGTVHGVTYFNTGFRSGVGYDMVDGTYGSGGNSMDLQLGLSGFVSEGTFSVGASYFPFAQGWVGGYVSNVIGLNGEASFDQSSATEDLDPSVVTWQPGTFGDFSDGLAAIDLTSFQNDFTPDNGMLFVAPNSQDNNTNIAGVLPNGNGWTVAIREDSELDDTFLAGSFDSQFQFMYVDFRYDGLIGGVVDGATGSVENGAGDFTLTRQDVGTYALQIPGKTDDNGNLILTIADATEADATLPERAFMSYEYDPDSDSFIIQVRELASGNDPFGEASLLTDASFYFTWVDFENPLTPQLQQAGTLSGSVFNDFEGDGVRGSTLEPGVEGIDFRVILPGDDGIFGTGDDVLFGTFTTATDGSYNVPDLPDGPVQVDLTDDTLPEAFLPVNDDPSVVTVMGSTTLDLAIRDARAPLPQIPAGAQAPGVYPVSSVSGANFNVALQPGSTLDGSGSNDLRVVLDGAGPFIWTDVRHNEGDLAPSISPYDPNDPASFPPDSFVEWAPPSGPSTHSWQVNHQVGLSFATVRTNGVDNQDTLDGVNPVGTVYGVAYFNTGFRSGIGYSMVDGSYGAGGNSQDLQMGLAGTPSEGSFDVAASFFPFSQGWVGGYVRNVAGPNGEASFDENSATEDLDPSVVQWLPGTFGDFSQGLARVDLTSFQSDFTPENGMLFVTPNSANNSANIAAVVPGGTGHWDVAIREDSELDDAFLTDISDAEFQFMYVDFRYQNLIGASVEGETGNVIRGAGDFTLERQDVGTYALTIPGKTGSDGNLLLTVSGASEQDLNLAERAFMSYDYDPDNGNFIIQIRELVLGSNPFGEDAALTDANFYFTWVDFETPVTPVLQQAEAPAVVINEFVFDNPGSDLRDFVEIYNADSETIDLGGWIIGSRDRYNNEGLNGPVYTIADGTQVAAGAYFVLGLPGTQNVDQVVDNPLGTGGRLFENRNETIELRDSDGNLIDAVYVEVNKEVTSTPAPAFPLPDDVVSEIGGGFWDNMQFAESPSNGQPASFARYLDGVDRDLNGLDFGVRPATPGTTNAPSVVTTFSLPDADSLGLLSPIPGFTAGSYAGPLTINPGEENEFNTNVIPSPPEGNTAIIAWDPAGGGNLVVSDAVLQATEAEPASFNILVYIDTNETVGLSGRSDFTAYGIGTAGPIFNQLDPAGFFAGTQVGTVGGVTWYLGRDENRVVLYLLEGDGGNSEPGNNVNILAQITLSDNDQQFFASDWYELGISVDAAGNISGSFSGTPSTTYTGQTVAGFAGSFFVGYLEVGDGNSAGRQDIRPATFVQAGSAAPQTLQVQSTMPTSSGVVVQFSRPISLSELNLYEDGTLGDPDLVLLGPDGQPINGTLIPAKDAQSMTFVATGGPLAAGDYTLTLVSAVNAFTDTDGELLDGNADGTAGGDYVEMFTVSAISEVVVSLPDFARFAGQAVVVPNTGAGLPITLSDVTGVTELSVELAYNPAVLTITGAEVAEGLPAGSTVNVDTSTEGIALVTFSSPSALSGTDVSLVNLVASVPGDAPAAVGQVLTLGNLSINGGAIPAVGDSAVHAASYFGDVNNDGSISVTDVTEALEVAAGQDSGFAARPLVDPRLVSDIDGDASVSVGDVVLLLQAAAGQVVPQIPLIP